MSNARDVMDLEADLPVMALRNRLLFPGVVIPFDVGREKSVAAVDAILAGQRNVIAVFAQRDPSVEDPGESDLYPTGCAALVIKRIKHSSGNYSLVLEGAGRIRLEGLTQIDPYLRARTRRLQETAPDAADLTSARLREAASRAGRLVELFLEDPGILTKERTPGALADLLAAHADLPLEDQVRLLETLDPTERQLQLLELLR